MDLEKSQGGGQAGQLPTFKVVIVGDQNVGKTCLIKRYTQGTFEGSEDTTLGAVFYSKKLTALYNEDLRVNDKNSSKKGPANIAKSQVSNDVKL